MMFTNPTNPAEYAVNEVMTLMITAGHAKKWSRQDGVAALTVCLAAMMVAHECEVGNENAMFSPVYRKLAEQVQKIYSEECVKHE